MERYILYSVLKQIIVVLITLTKWRDFLEGEEHFQIKLDYLAFNGHLLHMYMHNCHTIFSETLVSHFQRKHKNERLK